MSQNATFPLVRYFTRTSLIMISLVTLILVLTYRQQSINTMVNYGEKSNEVLTQALSNTIWPAFSGFTAQASTMTPEQLSQHQKILDTQKLVMAHIHNTPVLKIKIFDLNGKTIFSTDFSQLGVQKTADYPGSISARSGEIISTLSHRDSFEGLHRTHHDIDVVSSYVPIIDADVTGSGIAGVFEVYYDVTEQFDAITRRQFLAALFIAGMLFTLFIGLYFVVKRADRIIYVQRVSLNHSHKKYAEKKEALRNAQQTVTDTTIPGTIVRSDNGEH